MWLDVRLWNVSLIMFLIIPERSALLRTWPEAGVGKQGPNLPAFLGLYLSCVKSHPGPQLTSCMWASLNTTVATYSIKPTVEIYIYIYIYTYTHSYIYMYIHIHIFVYNLQSALAQYKRLYYHNHTESVSAKHNWFSMRNSARVIYHINSKGRS